MCRSWDSPGRCAASRLRCISSDGSLPDIRLDSLTALTSMVAGLEVGWGRGFPFLFGMAGPQVATQGLHQLGAAIAILLAEWVR